MVGVLANPTMRTSSHNAGYTFIYLSMLRLIYGKEVEVLKEGDNWDDYDTLWINEGVNFKEGQFNLFGGVNESLVSRLNKLNNFKGNVHFWGNFKPNYAELCRKRNIDVTFTKSIDSHWSPIESNKLVLGDSHSMSVYEPGRNIDRNDGKTLHGFLNQGIESFLDVDTEHLRFYAGNIDVRHHICRLHKNEGDRKKAITKMVLELESQLKILVNEDILKTVEIVELLPIENESRKLPKTGYYNKQPFWGSWEERMECVRTFNQCYRIICIRNGWKFLTWPEHFVNELGELDFEVMEARQSVHIAPKYYMFGESFVNESRKTKDRDEKKPKKEKVPQLSIVKVKDIDKAPTRSFEINESVLRAIDDYHNKSLAMQKYHFEFNPHKLTLDELKKQVNDDLIFNVPIYDMLDRKYAAFSSFLEAIKLGKIDPKGNGEYFDRPEMSEYNWIMLFYLFRLCGSGINYKPKYKEPFGTHGFGNFWLVQAIKDGDYEVSSWLKRLEELDHPFTDNKGYMLPQISYPNQKGGHLKRFILENVEDIILELHEFLLSGKKTIIEGVEFMNKMLVDDIGVKKQNFVMSATMADIAEYLPHLIDPDSMIYAGTNARRCIKAIFKKNKGYSKLQYESDCIQFLADRYEAKPYSVEDSRLCDVVRYFQDYQSPDHVVKNGGVKYKNNSTLRQELSEDEYNEFVKSISK